MVFLPLITILWNSSMSKLNMIARLLKDDLYGTIINITALWCSPQSFPEKWTMLEDDMICFVMQKMRFNLQRRFQITSNLNTLLEITLLKRMLFFTPQFQDALLESLCVWI